MINSRYYIYPFNFKHYGILALLLVIFSSGCLPFGNEEKYKAERATGPTADRSKYAMRKREEALKKRRMAKGKKQNRSEFEHNIAEAPAGPEASIRRDLEKLRELEREKLKNIEEMHMALKEGKSMVLDEENKLADLQNQINRYEDVLLSMSTQQTRDNRNNLSSFMKNNSDNNNRIQNYNQQPINSNYNNYNQQANNNYYQPRPVPNQYPINNSTPYRPDSNSNANYYPQQSSTNNRQEYGIPSPRENGEQVIWPANAPTSPFVSNANANTRSNSVPTQSPTSYNSGGNRQAQYPSPYTRPNNNSTNNVFIPDLYLSGNK